MSNDPKLLPCPFCGGEAIPFQADYRIRQYESWDVKCGTDGCFLEGGAGWRYRLDDIAVKWNTRAEEMRAEKIASLRKEIDRLEKLEFNV